MWLLRKLEKLETNLGGVAEMRRLPQAVFVDRPREGGARGARGAPLRHPGDRARRHELRPGRGRLRDPGQRRRDPVVQAIVSTLADAVAEGRASWRKAEDEAAAAAAARRRGAAAEAAAEAEARRRRRGRRRASERAPREPAPRRGRTEPAAESLVSDYKPRPPPRSRPCARPPAPASWTARAPSRDGGRPGRRRQAAARARHRQDGQARRPHHQEGLIEAYVHGGGASACSSRSAARPTSWPAPTSSRRSRTRSRCRSRASADARWVSREDVPADLIEASSRSTARRPPTSPRTCATRSPQGKLDKWLSTVCLLEQPYVRDGDRTVDDLRTEIAGKTGENVQIKRFTRYERGA